QGAVDQRLLTEPIAKKTTPVSVIESPSGDSDLNTKGSNGTRPQIKNAVKVATAASQGERICCGSPYSSVNIVLTQRARSEVIRSTSLVRSVPENPLFRKICLTSSRSPSGARSTWRYSMASRRLKSSCSALVPRKVLAAIENPSANRLAKPITRIIHGDNRAPATPLTTAKVVTEPSMPP